MDYPFIPAQRRPELTAAFNLAVSNGGGTDYQKIFSAWAGEFGGFNVALQVAYGYLDDADDGEAVVYDIPFGNSMPVHVSLQSVKNGSGSNPAVEIGSDEAGFVVRGVTNEKIFWVAVGVVA